MCSSNAPDTVPTGWAKTPFERGGKLPYGRRSGILLRKVGTVLGAPVYALIAEVAMA
jgi:hypothetical protein